MDKETFVDDVFIRFYNEFDHKNLTEIERQACDSFYDSCLLKLPFTKKQASYLRYILKKYQYLADDSLEFKSPFRVVDDSISVSVDSTDRGICLNFKFPYALLKTFESELEKYFYNHAKSYWDAEKKCRIISLYDCNLMVVQEFIEKYKFRKESSYLELESFLQESLNQERSIIPRSSIDNDIVILHNSSEDSEIFFKENKKNKISYDSLLAKMMGYPLELLSKSKTILEKIVSSPENFFWLKDVSIFLSMIKDLEIKTYVLIDRNDDSIAWLKDFVRVSKNILTDKKIKVCFREDKDLDSVGFNDWIKNNDLGGKIEDGNMFIFQHKPPKWIYKDTLHPNILVTNMITPPTHRDTQDFLLSHPCVIHLSEMKPTLWRNKPIVEL